MIDPIAMPSEAASGEWREIPSFPGYMASRDGRISGIRVRVMSPSIDRHGYPRVAVYVRGEGERHRYVHILVCEAFHGPRPSPSHEVAHGDGDSSNARADNLRWATPKENAEDKKLHGTWPAGEKNGRALLIETDVAEIRRIYAANMGKKYVKRGTREGLAARFGVNIDVIKDVVAGRSWRHVEIDLPFMAPPADGGAHA